MFEFPNFLEQKTGLGVPTEAAALPMLCPAHALPKAANASCPYKQQHSTFQVTASTAESYSLLLPGCLPSQDAGSSPQPLLSHIQGCHGSPGRSPSSSLKTLGLTPDQTSRPKGYKTFRELRTTQAHCGTRTAPSGGGCWFYLVFPYWCLTCSSSRMEVRRYADREKKRKQNKTEGNVATSNLGGKMWSS